MNDEYESQARADAMFRAVMRDRTPREVLTIIISTVVLVLFLEWSYDYIKFVLAQFGFYATLPFWFVCYVMEYWLQQFLGNFQFTKSNIFCASCIGIDMMVLTGYAMGKMTIGGYLMLAFAIGFLSGPILLILVEHMDENSKRKTSEPNNPSKDSFLTATLNRKVATYSFLFLVCVSVLNAWVPRF